MTDNTVRQEFEEWVVKEFGMDKGVVIESRFCEDGVDIYNFKDDEDKTIIVTSMYLAWQAGQKKVDDEVDKREYTGYEAGYEEAVNEMQNKLSSM